MTVDDDETKTRRELSKHILPSSGTITATGEIDYLPQSITVGAAATAADLLGIRTTLDALRAIERGGQTQGIRVVIRGYDVPTVTLVPVARVTARERGLAEAWLAGTP